MTTHLIQKKIHCLNTNNIHVFIFKNFVHNKRTSFLILFLLLIGAQMEAQNFNIKGIITDVSHSPVPDVHIILHAPKDSTQIVKSAITDAKGAFILSQIPCSNYILSASSIGYNKVQIRIENPLKDIDDLMIQMTDKYISLNEATVTANRVFNEFDRQIIFPKEFEKKNSMNGIELIDKLHLYGIIVDQTNNSIKALGGGTVQLRINGAPANMNEIQGIDPKLVIRVEYHDMPSIRYGDTAAVIDFYVKRKESGGSFKLTTLNAITTKNGAESANIKVNHKKSEFFVWGGYSFVRLNKNYDDKTTIYHYENDKTLTRREEGLPSKYHENIYNGGFSYSYLKPNNSLFMAKLSYSFNGTPDTGTGNSWIYASGQPMVHKQNQLSYQDKSPKISLYYQRDLKSKQLIAFEVMGSYTHTGSYNSYQEVLEGDMITDIFSNVNGESYSINAEGLYEKRFKKSMKINIGLSQGAHYAINKYRGSTNYQGQLNRYVTSSYFEWTQKIKKFNIAAGARGVLNNTFQESDHRSNANFSPTLQLGYQFSRNVQLRYNGNIYVTIPSLKNLNKVELAVDDYQTRRSNPDLTSTTTYFNSLSLNCFIKELMFTLKINDSYTIRPILGSTFFENDKFVTQVQNGKNSHRLSVENTLDWSAFDRHLNIYGRFGYCFEQNTAQDYSHSFNSFYCNAGINWTYKNFTLRGGFNKDKNILTNENISYRGQAISFGLDYKWRDLKIGASINQSVGHSYTNRIKSLNRFVLSDRISYMPEGNTIIRFRLLWNINFGRQRESNYQRIENSEGGSTVF